MLKYKKIRAKIVDLEIFLVDKYGRDDSSRFSDEFIKLKRISIKWLWGRKIILIKKPKHGEGD